MPSPNEKNLSSDNSREVKKKPSNKSISSKSSSSDGEVDDDIASIGTLHRELSEYLERTESTVYHELYPGVEMNEYDFIEERQHVFSTNILESTAHLIKGCLGAGIFGIHEGYMYGGIWASLLGTIVVGILVANCMLMLVTSAQIMYQRLRVTRLAYPDLAEAAIATGPLKFCRRYSKVFRYALEFFLFLEFNGTCCIFEIMIANTLKKVLEAVSTTIRDLQFSIRLYILIVTLPLLALCLIRSLKYLAPFSLGADVIIAMCVLITMYYSITIGSDLNERPAWKNIQGWFRFCGICIYSVDGVGVTLPIENHMRRPQYFKTVLNFGMSLVVPFIMIVGFFGYWAWGEECRTPITIHMSSSPAAIIMQFFLIASLAVTFAVHFWVPFRIIWHYLGRKYRRKRNLWERMYRMLHVLLITGLATAYPYMCRWMIILGSFFMAIIVFIFPAIIETLVMWQEPSKNCIRWVFLKDLCFILIGITLCTETIYSFFFTDMLL